MARKPKYLQLAAAQAQAAYTFYRTLAKSDSKRSPKPEGSPGPHTASTIIIDLTSDYVPESDSDGKFTDKDLPEFDEEMWDGFQKDMAQLKEPTPFEHLLVPKSTKSWKKTEQNWRLGYNGQGWSIQFWKDKKAHNLATACAVLLEMTLKWL
ncbi:hypothetical protein BDZ94DRAFT_1276357 [Collybia nuda]|uniref:Uncharacterized protein n=1 Tax=Collybia nuda TaxID=64659 RepID=A0A9P5XTB1_9AGAR|nr:hypothetical protein BDZ94DRAFT_1276357 [Collybia nuda]